MPILLRYFFYWCYCIFATLLLGSGIILGTQYLVTQLPNFAVKLDITISASSCRSSGEGSEVPLHPYFGGIKKLESILKFGVLLQ